MQPTSSRVLVVDDDRQILRAYSRILSREGHVVTAVESGEAALRAADDAYFDLAIVDHEMSGISGVECMQSLKEKLPTSPRILITGKLELPVVVGAVNDGAVMRVCTKPISPEALLDTVREALATRDKMLRAVRIGTRALIGSRSEILDCLGGDFLALAVQPIVRAPDSSVAGYEALLRSTHDVYTNPGAVLQAVEAHDLIDELADIVVYRAIEWLPKLPSDVRLFLNVHPKELANPDAFRDRLGRLRPWATRIVLELTERSRLSEIDTWAESIRGASDAGFSIALDDLGAGFSSLSMLADLQPQFVKVDMSIVRNVDSVPRKQRLVELLVRFSNATGATLVAEGVETEAEARTLRAVGAHLLQGYHFGRPSLQL